MKRLLDHDELTGISTYHEYDHANKKTIIESIQDIDPILALNKMRSGDLKKKENWWYIGTIPDTTILQWAKECGHNPYTKEWNEYSKKQLQKAEFRKLNMNGIKF